MKKQAKDELEELFEELGELEEVRALTHKKIVAGATKQAAAPHQTDGIDS